MDTKDEMNMKMYNAAIHLMEAAKWMSDVDGTFALRFAAIADKMLSIIDAPEQKVSDERMDNIMNEILNAEN